MPITFDPERRRCRGCGGLARMNVGCPNCGAPWGGPLLPAAWRPWAEAGAAVLLAVGFLVALYWLARWTL